MPQPPNAAISDRLARQLSGRCCYGSCLEDAGDGSDYCPPHHEATKARGRRWVASRRAELRKKRKCIGCRRKSKRLRCPACYRRWKERRVDNSERRVDNTEGSAPSRRTKIEIRTDGRAPTVRDTGRGHRGAPTMAETIADAQRESREARALAQRFEAALDLVLAHGVLDLPRQERLRIMAEVAVQPARAARHLANAALACDPKADVDLSLADE